MLKVSHISNIQIYTHEWDMARLGRFTSSRINVLMGEKNIQDSGAMTYIYHKVGDLLTKKSMATEDDIIEDENTAWGRENEPMAITKFGLKYGVKFLVTQKLILDPSTQFSSTPDAIWVHGASVIKEDEYNVSTLEVKCPRKYHKFIPLYKCKTPADLKAFNKNYYWQVIDQMYNCDSAMGYFACYHPLFPEGKNLGIIEFKKLDLWPEFKKMKERKEQAVKIFNEIKAEFAA
jgi:hypothetical protein